MSVDSHPAPVIGARRSGSPVALHQLDIGAFPAVVGAGQPATKTDGASIGLWRFDVDRGGLVLGSTQPWDDVDHRVAASLGIEVGRRRSGGGAVLLWPGGQVWIDVLVPRAHARWDDRVDVATHWIGEAWRIALAGFGVESVVHRGANAPGRIGGAVCFGGVGPGEVVALASGHRPSSSEVVAPSVKLVGIAQRRQRELARFQTSVAVGTGCPWTPDELGDLLRPASRRCDVPPADVARAIAPQPLPLDPERLAEEVAAALRTSGPDGDHRGGPPVG